MGTPHTYLATTSTHLWKFSHSYSNKFITTLFIYNYCYKLTLQDYWRFSFSVTCSDIGTICPRSFVLTVKIRQPSHEFTFGVGISFIPYPLVLTPVV
jgi:hypothetical protein